MSHLACYISNGLLALMLVSLYLSSQRERKSLLNRLLEKNDIPGIPEESGFGEVLKDLGIKVKSAPKEVVTEEQKRLIKRAQERVHFDIPNMNMPGRK